MFFGQGLVRTSEDFGSQGDRPSHPELLDWLATEFVRTGWDVKASRSADRHQRHLSPIVARVTRPRWKTIRRIGCWPAARGCGCPREMIRDQALAASGLLVERMGGPSVQAVSAAGALAGLEWAEPTSRIRDRACIAAASTRFGSGRSPRRRWSTFDAPTRETCIVRANAHQHAAAGLNLLNDVTYVEASRKLAERVIADELPPRRASSGPSACILARRPTADEARILGQGCQRRLARFQADRQPRKSCSKWRIPRTARLDRAELAAYAATASLIFNLDETVTKE